MTKHHPCLRAACGAFVVLVAASALLHAAESIRIVPLVREGHVLVSFELADGVSHDLSAAIRSGLQTTFTYTVDLRLDVPAWIDRTVSSSVISNTVQYDTLTRRHTVVRSVDGRVEETRVTEDEAAVREWLTTFHRLPLFSADDLEPNRDYYLRVRASMRPHNALFPLPWTGGGPSGQTKFTFIP